MEQGSKEWLAWRKTVITATEASIIMGNNPWDTPYTCWQRKLGLIEEKKTNAAMERGKRLEPIARERFIKKYRINMTPVVVESTEFDFLGASLDGLSDCQQYILEIKTGGDKLLQMANQGIIPEYYIDQMQLQMLATGAKKCFYHVAHEDEKKDVVLQLNSDPIFEQKFMPKAREFWRCVALNEPPPLQDSDYKDMSSEPHWKSCAEQYRKASEKIKVLEEIKESYRKELLKMCLDQSCIGNGLKVIKTAMKGRIVYDEIPELKGIDLDKYRKDSTTLWKILLD